MTTIEVSAREREIIVGTILRDGHLAMLKSNARLEIGHSDAQKDYLFWKYSQLPSLVGAPPSRRAVFDSRYQKTYAWWRISTRARPFLTELYYLFYFRGRKIVPRAISSLLTSPLGLAVWFMDDGGRRNDSYGHFFNTLSFSREENELLRECLRENFSLDSRIHWIQDGYRIYISSREAKHFCDLLYPLVLPLLRYKLSFNPVTTSYARLDRARDRVPLCNTLVSSLKKRGIKV